MNLKHIQRDSKCLNCETSLDKAKDNFCPNCGQLNNVKKESAFELIKELVGDFLHLDSKVMGTLIPLLFKPGLLTKQYNSGHRANFLHPVRMFISIMIIFVIISGLGKSHVSTDEIITPPLPDSVKKEIETNITKEDLAKLAELTNNKYQINLSDDSTANFNVNVDRSETMDQVFYFSKKGVKDVDVLLDSLNKEKTFFNRVIYTQALKLTNLKEIKSGLKEYIVHKLPWIIFSLMPVFAFILWLLYYSRKIMLVDHMVYAFHLHAFVFLLWSIFDLVEMVAGFDLSIISNLYLLIYLPVSLKRVYGQSWRKTIAKLLLLLMFYTVLGLFSTFIVLAILFFLY